MTDASKIKTVPTELFLQTFKIWVKFFILLEKLWAHFMISSTAFLTVLGRKTKHNQQQQHDQSGVQQPHHHQQQQ